MPDEGHRSRIGQRLADIDAPGAVAASRTRSARDLRLTVREVGRLAWPLKRSDAQRLIAVARPARYGLRDQTRLDARVRDSWEIAKGRLTIESEPWTRTLDPVLEELRRDLGLPDGARLRAALHNLLVYQPGQFFRAHQDSEKADDMIGSLVVILPSKFTGGALVLEHQGQRHVFRGTAGKLTFVAFYADCHHQVQPVKSGFRVAFTFNLMLAGGGAGAVPPASRVGPLVKAVDAYFRTPRPMGVLRERDLPDRLVYLLDHQYTRRTLGWHRLKRVDAVRAAALRDVARQLDCEVALALADVHEQWSSEDDGFDALGFREPYRGWDDEDAGDEDEDAIRHDEEPALGELLDSDVELRHWLGATGRPMKGAGFVSMDEVCSTRESTDFPPFNSEHEGYMGNWGNTVDRWYHRAAVVLWPRSRNFAIRAKTSPAWAVDEILKMTRSPGGRDAARRAAATLMPFWSSVARREEEPRFSERLVQLTAALEDPALAASLLQPLALEALSPKAATRLPAVVEQYGLDWMQGVVGQWTQARRTDESAWVWLAQLPAICRPLCADPASDAATFARWLLREQWQRLAGNLREGTETTPPAMAIAELSRLAPAVLGMLAATRLVGESGLHRDVVAFLTSADTGYPIDASLRLLRAAHRTQPRRAVAHFGLEAVHAHCGSILDERLRAPVRESGDWSIAPPGRCRCALCRRLREFLAARDRVQFDWPLAKDGRQHVHRVLDAHALPVTHVTRRTGRPFTLVLRKTEALFEREAADRMRWKKDLAWLRRGVDES